MSLKKELFNIKTFIIVVGLIFMGVCYANRTMPEHPITMDTYQFSETGWQHPGEREEKLSFTETENLNALKEDAREFYRKNNEK